MSEKPENIKKGDAETNREQDEQQNEHQDLQAEVSRLKEELRGLQENTIIESMNDLKKAHDNLSKSATCMCIARQLCNRNYAYQRTIVALGVNSWSLYESFEDILEILRKNRGEVLYEGWNRLREKAEHHDHCLKQMYDLCEESNIDIADIEDGTKPLVGLYQRGKQ
ncbi:uncharacterized protein EV422DRAFT_508706 [Fimicolochytrium jonesii]|uniref:uncharacterized protein n=1 Tax=Fimicolochytrium jonesii TaxID=1396493 RepID=UPI0022FE535D|nr:uncharacterized protein EV422DRAFT_508706 [Fimicolochytrium jonesii]KAI8817884.1 hypothetical protein EV422DRAFT_508706 [Fimicolochytrium jonesii]